MSESTLPDKKLSLPAFLKVLTSNNVPVPKAMAVAGKIYKTYNTPRALGQLNDLQLKNAGVDEKEDRKLVLAAMRKGGYKSLALTARKNADTTTTGGQGSSGHASTSTPKSTPSPRKKRKRGNDDVNELLPGKPSEELEGATYGSLEFNEVLDEETLMTKSTVVNRAPIMMAWATIVAERIGFKREEALSIASVYTEMNAITKGVSLGIYGESRKSDVPEPRKDGSQPYVELMGRSPLYQTASNSWLALSASKPVPPSSAYSYITRSLRQTAPHIIGALRLLAESYEPDELGRKGFMLYCEFRPEVGGWGQKGTVTCETILSLRKNSAERNKGSKVENEADVGLIPQETIAETCIQENNETDEGEIGDDRDRKKPRGLTFEEYEAALDEDPDFDAIDFNELDLP